VCVCVCVRVRVCVHGGAWGWGGVGGCVCVGGHRSVVTVEFVLPWFFAFCILNAAPGLFVPHAPLGRRAWCSSGWGQGETN
jgi:hypothetical protein